MSREKVERNNLILKRYKPLKHGYKKVAKEFGIDHMVVKRVIDRHKKKMTID